LARYFLSLAAASGFLAVALGAFGAHALRGYLDTRAEAIFETAVLYHFVHTLVLLMVAVLCRGPAPGRTLQGAGVAFTLGIALFSGSLYLLAITGSRWLGIITPFGGVSFLVGWLLLLTWSLRGESR
jgi:uncharacterized membrane protein YgdD (TMEM256/DUF423 family)